MRSEKFLELFRNVGKLKTTPRSGWSRVGVPKPESVADHTFRTTVMAMVLGDNLNLDTNKLLKLALLHDLPEALIGDITPYDELPPEEKRIKEEGAIKELLKELPHGDEYTELWQEYDQQKSAEAILLKNIDKLEMALQAEEYKKLYPDLDLTEFFTDVENQINLEEIREIFEIIRDS